MSLRLAAVVVQLLFSNAKACRSAQPHGFRFGLQHLDDPSELQSGIYGGASDAGSAMSFVGDPSELQSGIYGGASDAGSAVQATIQVSINIFQSYPVYYNLFLMIL